jgi:SAM-dependent methyltransferase
MPQYQYSTSYNPVSKSFPRSLSHAAAEPYLWADWYAYWFARIKLRIDPAFVTILKQGLIPDSSHVLDLGCGQGLLASSLLTARALATSHYWPEDWAAPPVLGSIRGMDLMARDIERAQRVLGQYADFSVQDIVHADYGRTDVIVILDVLHYMDYDAQEEVLLKARRSLPPHGRLILRVGNADGGFWFWASYFYDRLICWLRTGNVSRLYCRTHDQWLEFLQRAGFQPQAAPLHGGMKFANTLLLATPSRDMTMP